MNFFEFLSTEFVAGSMPQSGDNHCKASYLRTQQCDEGAGEHKSCDQGRGIKTFDPLSATLSSKDYNRKRENGS